MDNVKKIAITVVTLVIIATIYAVVSGNLLNFLNGAWNWVFTSILKTPAPPSPFGG